jgi:hypothetical protein
MPFQSESRNTVPYPLRKGDTNQVFSLVKNWTWSYDYKKRYIYREMGSMWWGIFDSGSVVIKLLDSMKTSDTTIMWSYLEEQHISHCYYRYDNGVPLIPDSMYSRDTSIVRGLHYDTRGRQPLTSNGLIWYFPIQSLDTLIPVLRIDQSAVSIVAADRFDGYDWINDTLYFSSTKGLFRRCQVRHGWTHTSPVDSLQITLKSIVK